MLLELSFGEQLVPALLKNAGILWFCKKQLKFGMFCCAMPMLNGILSPGSILFIHMQFLR